MAGPEIAAIIASVVATVASTAGSIYASQRAADAEEYQADVARVQGQQAQMAAEAEAQDRRRRSRYLLGQQLAAAGASGVQLEGSPLLAMVDSGVQEDLERRRILYKGYLQAQGARSDAALAEYQASSLRTAGYMKAGTSLLRGTGNVYGYSRYGSSYRG